MGIINVHERVLDAPAAKVGELIDGLASADDKLWPHDCWPAMRFDRPLSVGAVGGHGPIRYVIESYEPGRYIQFRFTEPKGFLGTHRFEVVEANEGRATLHHVIEMKTTGIARLTWPLMIRPLHDALIEDALDRAARSIGAPPAERKWSLWVRLLRRLLG